jgi:hypothetical protein
MSPNEPNVSIESKIGCLMMVVTADLFISTWP